MGQQIQAIEMLDRALERGPERADILNVKGDCHSEIGQLDQAQASYEKALELEPTNPVFQFNLANTLRSRGDLEASRIALDELLAEDPWIWPCSAPRCFCIRWLQSDGRRRP